MIEYKLILILCEAFIFGIFALGIYVSFGWFRFPDLTPDGSFTLGACIYVKCVNSGYFPIESLLISFFVGFVAGTITAIINRVIKVPTVIAGLLVGTALYSISWIILNKPNEFLDPQLTLIGDVTGITGAYSLLIWLILITSILIFFLFIFSNSIWGLKGRAISENNLLALDLKTSETRYTFLFLALSNAIVALAGALFTQKSFSADINMGVGQTIVGLIAMMLGLVLARNYKNTLIIILAIILGSIIYKLFIFIALELGLPAESFKMISSLLLVFVFFLTKIKGEKISSKLKWN